VTEARNFVFGLNGILGEDDVTRFLGDLSGALLWCARVASHRGTEIRG
jgi:hypothetical protein